MQEEIIGWVKYGKRTVAIPRNIGNLRQRPDLIILDDMEENMAEEVNENVGGEYEYKITVPESPYIGVYPQDPLGTMAIPGRTKFHQVKIDRVANGFVIEIGCKKFVAEKWDDLAKKLGDYWKDPIAAEKKYCK
jgi:hypothetical protein